MGENQLIGPMSPKVSASSQMARPTPKPGANEFAAPAHLQGQVNGGEAADQSANKQRRIDSAEQECCPTD